MNPHVSSCCGTDFAVLAKGTGMSIVCCACEAECGTLEKDMYEFQVACDQFRNEIGEEARRAVATFVRALQKLLGVLCLLGLHRYRRLGHITLQDSPHRIYIRYCERDQCGKVSISSGRFLL